MADTSFGGNENIIDEDGKTFTKVVLNDATGTDILSAKTSRRKAIIINTGMVDIYIREHDAATGNVKEEFKVGCGFAYRTSFESGCWVGDISGLTDDGNVTVFVHEYFKE